MYAFLLPERYFMCHRGEFPQYISHKNSDKESVGIWEWIWGVKPSLPERKERENQALAYAERTILSAFAKNNAINISDISDLNEILSGYSEMRDEPYISLKQRTGARTIHELVYALEMQVGEGKILLGEKSDAWHTFWEPIIKKFKGRLHIGSYDRLKMVVSNAYEKAPEDTRQLIDQVLWIRPNGKIAQQKVQNVLTALDEQTNDPIMQAAQVFHVLLKNPIFAQQKNVLSLIMVNVVLAKNGQPSLPLDADIRPLISKTQFGTPEDTYDQLKTLVNAIRWQIRSGILDPYTGYDANWK